VRVGVTGSTGLIGHALVAALASRGDEVVRFVRPRSTPATSGVVVAWDPTSDFVDEAALASAGELDALVHLAGAGIADRRWTSKRREEILTSRTRSTALLVEAFAKRPPRHVLSGSAIGYYGDTGDTAVDEASPRGTGFLADVCVAWESAATGFSDAGATLTLLRTGIVQSAGGGALAKQLPLFRLGLGGQLGAGRQWLSPISLRDEVGAILHLLDHAVAGPVNLVAPCAVTNGEFTRALGRVLHRPTVARVPHLALEVALGRELAREAILASQRVTPRVLRETGFTFADPTVEELLTSALRQSR
jgi:uncharacterized protein